MRFELAHLDKYIKGLMNKPFYVIILLFIAITLVKIILSLPFTTPYVMWDDVLYDSVARNVLEGKLYTKSIAYSPTVLPGYPIVISIAYLFSEDKDVIYHIILVINAILTSSIIFPSYFLLKRYCTKELSILGSAVISVLPSVFLYSFTLFSENLFIPLFVFSIWFLIESYENNDPIWQFLAAFSIMYLFLTRATGIAMLVGFVISFIYYLAINARSKKILAMIKEKIVLLLTFLIPGIAWLVYSSFFTYGSYSMGNPYNIQQSLTNNLFIALSGIDFFIQLSVLAIHELDYLIVATYSILFILVVYLCVKQFTDKNSRKEPLLIALTYFIVSSISLFVVTLSFMYSLNVIGGDPIFSIYGRYIEPIIPGIFIFGFIGLGTIYTSYNKVNKRMIVTSGMTYLVSLILLVLTLPHWYYKYPDNNSLHFVEYVDPVIPIEWFLAILLATVFVFFLLSIRQKVFRVLLLLLLVCSSMFVSIHPYRLDIDSARLYENQNQIGRYLQNHSDKDTIILMDPDIMNSEKGRIFWALTTFWIDSTIIPDPRITYTTNDSVFIGNADYLLSSKLLPYPVVCASNGTTYKLYSTTVSDDDTCNLPYTINIGDATTSIFIDNFYTSEGTTRWTKNLSRVLIEYPSKEGDMSLTVSTLGYRPINNPAHMTLYINNNLIIEKIKPAGEYVYEFTVPQEYLYKEYQILEIETNTWCPLDYGYNDNRDLGVMIDNLTISKHVQ